MATYPKIPDIPTAPEKKINKVYVFIVDFDPEKKDFIKMVKRKTNQKTVCFDYESFHNKTFSYLLEQYDNRTFIFNLKDDDCREWLSLCLREIKKHNIIVVYKSKQPWIEKIEPQIIVPFKRFHKLILCQNPDELYDVRVHLPKPKNLIMRILNAFVNCFLSKNKEYINC